VPHYPVQITAYVEAPTREDALKQIGRDYTAFRLTDGYQNFDCATVKFTGESERGMDVGQDITFDEVLQAQKSADEEEDSL
jgi:hypothetical protein